MLKLTTILLVGASVALGACATQQMQTPAQRATEARHDSDYANAIHNCDMLGSAERATCIQDAKAKYGES